MLLKRVVGFWKLTVLQGLQDEVTTSPVCVSNQTRESIARRDCEYNRVSSASSRYSCRGTAHRGVYDFQTASGPDNGSAQICVVNSHFLNVQRVEGAARGCGSYRNKLNWLLISN